MNIELILAGIIIVLLIAFGWYIREQGRERSKLINAILSKDSQEYINRTLAEQTEIKPEVAQAPPDLISTDQLNDEEFDDHIASELSNMEGEREL